MLFEHTAAMESTVRRVVASPVLVHIVLDYKLIRSINHDVCTIYESEIQPMLVRTRVKNKSINMVENRF